LQKHPFLKSFCSSGSRYPELFQKLIFSICKNVISDIHDDNDLIILTVAGLKYRLGCDPTDPHIADYIRLD